MLFSRGGFRSGHQCKTPDRFGQGFEDDSPETKSVHFWRFVLGSSKRSPKHRMKISSAALCMVLTSFAWLPARAETIPVSGFANIFGAGKSVAPGPGTHGGGIIPPAFNFSTGPNQTIVFTDVSGLIEGAPGDFAPPDGVIHPVNAESYEGIAGVRSPVAVPLSGVFLGPEEPTDPAPDRLDFRVTEIRVDFNELLPVIGQVFIIGDGLTGNGSGTRQLFHVPSNATRLYLGIFDGFHLGDNVPKLPGYYNDNGGAFTATVELLTKSSLAIVPGQTSLSLRWQTQSDVNYQPQWTDLLHEPTWLPLGTAITGTGQMESVVIQHETPPERFYRLIVSP
jgi:hypothetical protein